MSDDDDVTPPGLHSFFEASAGVAGTLIGLLFVVISVAQERLTAPDASQAHRVRASAALTAFTNALTISLFAMVPGGDLGGTALAVGILGLLFVTASLMSLLRVRHTPQAGQLRDTLFLVSLAITMALQIWMGLSLLRDSENGGPARTIAILVVVCFLIGIARSWELIGGPSIGLRGEVGEIVRTRAHRTRDDADADDGEG